MKKALLFSAAALVLMAYGCKKESGYKIDKPVIPVDTVVVIDSAAMKFNVGGVTDLDFFADMDSVFMPLSAQITSGEQEKLTFSVDGLPANVTATFETPQSGYPDFTTLVKIKSNFATAGTYPLAVIATTASGRVKKYNFNLKLNAPELGPKQYAAKFRAFYQIDFACGTGSTGSSFVDTTGNANEIEIMNFPGLFSPVLATVNVSNKSVTIPMQVVSGTTVSGSGTFTDYRNFKINYTLVNGSTTSSCTATFEGF